MTTKTLVGTSFAGYRVEAVLGRGGMSIVYLAEHPRLQNKVALKLLAPALAEDDLFRDRLVRESRLAASLNHPNVIPVYDTGEEDGALYVSMRFVSGQDLRSLIRDAGPLSLSDTAAVISQAASALDAAHAAGLVHRDIKPANILLEQGGESPGHVYVADFGLTKHTDARTGAPASGVVGTVDYMAPEQIEGRQVDGRADVYALGCVLFECLVGHAPFKRETDVAVLWAHIREDPPLPSDIRGSLPRAFDGVVDRALAKNPRNRYATCGELAADVRTAAGARKRTRSTRITTRPRPRPRRRWRGPALLALLIGAAVGAGAAIAVHGTGGRPGTGGARATVRPNPTLLANVPHSIRSSCIAQPAPSPDYDASVVCRPGDPTVSSVRYSHARSASRMRAQLLAAAWAAAAAMPGQTVAPVGDCSKGSAPSVHDWNVTAQGKRTQAGLRTPGRNRGRLLCFTSVDGWSAVEWTDKDYDIYSIAYGSTRYGLYRWWRVRGGPTPAA
jgi:serine/threonine protein kinase